METPPPVDSRTDRRARRPWVWAGAVMALVALLIVGWQFLLQRAAAEIRIALGLDVTVGNIEIHWRGVELQNLALAAPPGWPTQSAARVSHIRVVPEWLSLVSNSMRLAWVEVTGAEVSVWKAPDGKWRALPAMTEKAQNPSGKGTARREQARRMSIGKIEVKSAALTMIDGQISKPAHKMVFRNIDATIRDFHIGGEPSPVLLDGTGRTGLKGHARIQGRVTPGILDSALQIDVQRIPLSMVEPYLLKAAEAGVKRGEFDLQMRLNIANKALDAPGKVLVHDLELKSATDSPTFMGLPREALVDRLKDRDGRIEIPFHLHGRVDDPSFSLGAAFKAKLALAAADVLGLHQILGELAKKSGVTSQVERAAEKIKEWFRR